MCPPSIAANPREHPDHRAQLAALRSAFINAVRTGGRSAFGKLPAGRVFFWLALITSVMPGPRVKRLIVTICGRLRSHGVFWHRSANPWPRLGTQSGTESLPPQARSPVSLPGIYPLPDLEPGAERIGLVVVASTDLEQRLFSTPTTSRFDTGSPVDAWRIRVGT